MALLKLTALGTLALVLMGFSGGSISLGQEIVQETSIKSPGNWIAVANRQETLIDGQVITIVSERVIEPQNLFENDSESERASESLTSTVSNAAKEKASEASTNPESLSPASQDDTSTSKSECECLCPGGKIWEKLLGKELENARLTARVELEEEKLKLHREHMGERIRELEAELERRNRERVARDREIETVMQLERRQFEKQREELQRHVSSLEQRLEVAGRGHQETDELREVLKENQARNERLADENAAMKAKLRHFEEALEVAKQKLAEKMEEQRKPEHKDEHSKEKGKNDRKKKESL